MAENKKGFILYADQKELFNQLPNDKAGELIKHILSYVNDENPITEDLIINLAFIPIKQQLKRDLKKFEASTKQRSEAGKRSAEVRKNQRASTKSTSVESRSTKSTVTDKDTVTDTVTVKVKDNDTVKDIYKKEVASPVSISKFNFRKELHSLVINPKIVDDWLAVRKLKKAANTETALKGFLLQVDKQSKTVEEVLTLCVESSWSGFKAEWLENKEVNCKQSKQQQRDEEIRNILSRPRRAE